MQDNLGLMLEMQRQLQLVMPPPNRVPGDLRGEDRATFVTWNMFAIEDELHEAIAEMGWKPWATSRHLNADAMLKEMIDAWHFFMNVLLVIAGEKGWTTQQLAEEFTKVYIAKNAVNVERQQEGYDGVSSKCPVCHRELSEVDFTFELVESNKEFCSPKCAATYMELRKQNA
jgi:hypothetical protein